MSAPRLGTGVDGQGSVGSGGGEAGIGERLGPDDEILDADAHRGADRAGDQVGDRSGRRRSAPPEDGEVVEVWATLDELVARHEHGAAFGGEGAEQQPHLADAGRVETVAARRGRAAPGSSGGRHRCPGAGASRGCNADTRSSARSASPTRSRTAATSWRDRPRERGEELEVAPSRHRREERRCLDDGAHRGSITVGSAAGTSAPSMRRPPAVGRTSPRRQRIVVVLARPVGPEEPEHAALRDDHVEAVDGQSRRAGGAGGTPCGVPPPRSRALLIAPPRSGTAPAGRLARRGRGSGSAAVR
jgi:hypothetical protein